MSDKWNQRARRLLQKLVGTNTSPSAIAEVTEVLRTTYNEGVLEGAHKAATAISKSPLMITDLRGGFIADGKHQKKSHVE